MADTFREWWKFVRFPIAHQTPHDPLMLLQRTVCAVIIPLRDCRFFFLRVTFSVLMHKSFATYKNKYRTSITLEITNLGI